MTRFCTLLLAIFASAANLSAATYYIDYGSGSDSNNGTSKSSPWQRCPGMPGFNHSYSHSAGDRFIFKGGATWPANCFPCVIRAGGSSDALRDYYGVDQSWFSGGSWSRPIFDGQQTQFAAGLNFAGGSWYQVDNLEMKNFFFNGATPVGAACILGIYNDIEVDNCLIHDWGHSNPTAPGSDGGYFGAFFAIGGAIKNCIAHQAGISQKSGSVFRNCGNISFCEAYECANVALGYGNVHDNHFHHMRPASDPNAHTNTIYMFTGGTVYNNIIHDVYEPGNQIIYCVPGSINPNQTLLVYNNVVYDGGGTGSYNGCIEVDPDGGYTNGVANSASSTIRIFNNTCQHNGATMRIAARTGGKISGTVELANNHNIGNGIAIDPGSVTNLINHNSDISQTISAAAAAGYTANNLYRPTSSSSGTVDRGVSLANFFTTDRAGARRPAGNAWDVGAYEFGGAATNPAPIPAPSATPGASVTPAPTTTPQPTSTPAPPAPSPTVSPAPDVLGLSFDSVDGIVSMPFVSVGGGIGQALETDDPALGGRAVYTFNVPEEGTYGISVDVNCPTDANNSFFVNIDAEPIAPSMIWDVAVSTGVEQRLVNWRGAGTYDASEFSPKLFSLSQGVHQLILRGRESSAEIDHISVVKVPSPPSNLAVRP